MLPSVRKTGNESTPNIEFVSNVDISTIGNTRNVLIGPAIRISAGESPPKFINSHTAAAPGTAHRTESDEQVQRLAKPVHEHLARPVLDLIATFGSFAEHGHHRGRHNREP